MNSPSGPPRLPPLQDHELNEQQRALLEAVGGPAGDAAGNSASIFRTFVRHPGLFRRWLPFGGKLLTGKLPGRDRELLILRTAFNCRSVYEWAQHVRIALAVGISEEEIARVVDGPGAWTEPEATLLRAADELHQSSRLSDETWSELAEMYDETQLIEVPMVVGHYHLVAFTLNSLGVPLEPGLDPAGADQWGPPRARPTD